MSNDTPLGAGSQLPSPFASENRALMNQIISEVISQVKQTSDAIEPAERVEKERKKISCWR